mgnify:CR=1 FL=1
MLKYLSLVFLTACLEALLRLIKIIFLTADIIILFLCFRFQRKLCVEYPH